MSIRPPYAAAILDGTKLVEFRKRRLASDIDTVVIYMTSPVMAVVGHFTVTEQVTGSPRELWERFEQVAGIDADAYNEYFDGTEDAVGIVIDTVTIYDEPLPLDDIDPGGRPPQSYKYLAALT